MEMRALPIKGGSGFGDGIFCRKLYRATNTARDKETRRENAMRTGSGPECRRFYKLCDSLRLTAVLGSLGAGIACRVLAVHECEVCRFLFWEGAKLT